MFIEFLGLPGSGKTYFSNSVKEKMKLKNTDVLNVTELTRSKLIYKIIAKILLFTARSGLFFKSLRKDIRQIVCRYDTDAAYNTCRIWSYVDDITVQVLFKRVFKKKNTVYILDEGICQKLVNIIVNYGVSDEDTDRLSAVLAPYTDRTFFLCMETKDAFDSIRKRNRHVCIMDELNDDDLRVFLQKYYQACIRLSDSFQADRIDRNDVDKVCSEIK